MDSLSDAELEALLEALHIALRVSVVFPPLEQSRLYSEIDLLWQKFGTEAIARGLSDYAQFHPEDDNVNTGPALESGSDAEDAIAYHNDESFWRTLALKVAIVACEEAHGKRFHELTSEQQGDIRIRYEQRASDLLEKIGIRAFLNCDTITDNS